MDLDEDEPPLLVSENGAQDDPSTVSAEMEGIALAKVPITIVTGRARILCNLSVSASSVLLTVNAEEFNGLADADGDKDTSGLARLHF